MLLMVSTVSLSVRIVRKRSGASRAGGRHCVVNHVVFLFQHPLSTTYFIAVPLLRSPLLSLVGPLPLSLFLFLATSIRNNIGLLK